MIQFNYKNYLIKNYKVNIHIKNVIKQKLDKIYKA